MREKQSETWGEENVAKGSVMRWSFSTGSGSSLSQGQAKGVR